MRRKHKEPEENVQTDRYLITYADLITLLLGLFVILYASSKVDEDKYKQITSAFSDYFKSTKGQVLQGSSGVLPGFKKGLPEPIMPNPSDKSLDEIKNETEISFKEYIEKGTVSVRKTKNEIVLTLSEKLLFSSGKADIHSDAFSVLDTLAQILKGIPYQISVDGHTDDTPINTARFPSNWHLSNARALNIGYYLIQNGTPQHNLLIRGFAEQKPISDNLTDEGRAKNRRVEITINKLTTDMPSTDGYTSVDSLKKNLK